MIKFKSIGSDPEFAIRKDNINLPSFMFIEGTKKEPKLIHEGFYLLKDNLLIEGNIPPSTNYIDFKHNMLFLQELIDSIVASKNAYIYYEDIVKFNKRFIFTDDGQEFGCSNYLDAWEKICKPSPQLGESLLRPVGTHIHVGYELDESIISKEDMNYLLARAYDYFVSLPSDTIHYSKERRENYGAYGSFRDTEYGIEFRSLGGYFSQPSFLKWIYNQTLKTIDYCNSQENCEKLNKLKKPSYDDYEFLGIDLLEQVPAAIEPIKISY